MWLETLFSNWFFDFTVLVILAVVVAFAFKKKKLAQVALGAEMIAFSTDQIFPPYSACSIARPGMELVAKALQNVRLTDDLVSCTLAKLHLNFLIGEVTWPNAIYLILPVFVLMVLAFLVLVFLAKKERRPARARDLWITAFSFLAFALVVLYTLDGTQTDAVRLTFAAVLAYGIIPPILYVWGTHVIASASR